MALGEGLAMPPGTDASTLDALSPSGARRLRPAWPDRPRVAAGRRRFVAAQCRQRPGSGILPPPDPARCGPAGRDPVPPTRWPPPCPSSGACWSTAPPRPACWWPSATPPGNCCGWRGPRAPHPRRGHALHGGGGLERGERRHERARHRTGPGPCRCRSSGAEHLVRPVTPWSCSAAPIREPDTRRRARGVGHHRRHRGGHPADHGPGPGHGRRGGGGATAGPPQSSTRPAALAFGSGRPAPGGPRPTRGAADLRAHRQHAEPAAQRDGCCCWRCTRKASRPPNWRSRCRRTSTRPSPSAPSSPGCGPPGADRLGFPPVRAADPDAPDLRDVQTELERGNIRRAVELYRGPVLPQSQAPAVEGLREDLHQALRSRLIAVGEADSLLAFADTAHGHDDYEIWRAAAPRCPNPRPGSRGRDHGSTCSTPLWPKPRAATLQRPATLPA